MPHFRTRPSTYSISFAPSGRARCRGCKGVEGKGELRFVTHAFVRPGRGTKFVRHIRCVTAAVMREVVSVYGSIEHVPLGVGVDNTALASVFLRV